MRTIRALLLVGIAAAASSGAAAGPVDIQKVRRIVTLGDSITQGGEQPGGYVWQMRQYLQVLSPGHKIEVINSGISGHKSNDMLARFERDVLRHKPDLVTISVGINDVWHGFTPEHPAGYGPRAVPLAEFTSNVEYMIAAAEKAGVRVVLFTTTIFEDSPDSPRNRRVALYNDALRALAAGHDHSLADQNQAFWDAWKRNQVAGGGPARRLTTDQVHLSAEGNTLMARTALLALGITARQMDATRADVQKRQAGR